MFTCLRTLISTVGGYYIRALELYINNSTVCAPSHTEPWVSGSYYSSYTVQSGPITSIRCSERTPITVEALPVCHVQLISKRADAVERRLKGEAPDLNDPIERVKEHTSRVGACSVRYQVSRTTVHTIFHDASVLTSTHLKHFAYQASTFDAAYGVLDTPCHACRKIFTYRRPSMCPHSQR